MHVLTHTHIHKKVEFRAIKQQKFPYLFNLISNLLDFKYKVLTAIAMKSDKNGFYLILRKWTIERNKNIIKFNGFQQWHNL